MSKIYNYNIFPYRIIDNEAICVSITGRQIYMYIFDIFKRNFIKKYNLPKNIIFDILSVHKIDNTYILICIKNDVQISIIQVVNEVTRISILERTLQQKSYCFQIEDTIYLVNSREDSEIYLYDNVNNCFSWIAMVENYAITNLMAYQDGFLADAVYVKSRKSTMVYLDRNFNLIKSIQFNINSKEKILDVLANYAVVETNVFSSKKIALLDVNTESISWVDLPYNATAEYQYLSCDRRHNSLMFHEINGTSRKLIIYQILNSEIHCMTFDPIVYMVAYSADEIILITSMLDSIMGVYKMKKCNCGWNINCIYGENKYSVLKYSTQIKDRLTDFITYAPAYKNKKACIFYLHGGPRIHWIPKHNALFTMFYERSYEVVYINYFGSKGRRWADDDYNYIVEKGIEETIHIIRNRVGGNAIIFGESHGAHLAFMAWLSEPFLFKHLILSSPYYSWKSLYENSRNDLVKKTMKKYRNNILPEKFIYTDILKMHNTSIDIIHGLEDNIIPYSESIKIHKFVKDNYPENKNTLHLLGNMSHSPQSMKEKIIYFSELEKIMNEIRV